MEKPKRFRSGSIEQTPPSLVGACPARRTTAQLVDLRVELPSSYGDLALIVEELLQSVVDLSRVGAAAADEVDPVVEPAPLGRKRPLLGFELRQSRSIRGCALHTLCRFVNRQMGRPG